jgi:GxxExxY protein
MVYEKELSDKIIGCAINVHKALGSSYMEKLYENALLIELAEAGIKVMNQVPIQVKYKEQIIGDYKLDVVVEDKVVLELKPAQELFRFTRLNYCSTWQQQD